MLLALLPTLIVINRANKAGTSISFKDAFGMAIRKSFDNNLILAYGLVQEHNISLTLIALEAHKLASGNPLKCVEGLIYAKEKGIETNWTEVSAVDLTNKDIINIIDIASENFKTEIRSDNLRDAKLRRVEMIYQGEYKVSFGKAWLGPPDKQKIENDTLPRIIKYIENSDNDDLNKASKIITETIIDIAFWESKGMTLIRQNLIFQYA